MKKLAKIKGTNVLSSMEQKSILGGNPPGGVCAAPKIECYNPYTHRWSCVYEQNCP